MRNLGIAALAAILPVVVSQTAEASRHPQSAQTAPAFIDSAAIATYPLEREVNRPVRRHRERHSRRHSKPEPRHRVERPAPRQRAAPIAPIVKPVLDEAAKLGALLGFPEGWQDGLTTSAHLPPVELPRRPRQIVGEIEIGGVKFHFVSGGYGWSIPYGHHEITPSDVGPWGQRHGALGLDGDTMWDKQLRRDREGIEIHAARGGTAGCVGVRDFQTFKHAVHAMIEKFGSAFLHVLPGGAAVTPQKEWLPSATTVALRAGDDDESEPRRRHHVRRRYASR